MSGPVSRALAGSRLSAAIKPGIQAIPSINRSCVDDTLRSEFADSIDLDEATREQHPNDKRWDYLLGHRDFAKVVALETHSAETSEVSVVIQKRAASLVHLRAHLVDGHRVAAWYWVASGRVDFVPHEKAINRLNENGIAFVGRRLTAKDIAPLRAPVTSPPRRGSRR